MASVGPNNPSSGTSPGGGDRSWSNPGNVFSSNNSYATAFLTSGGVPTTDKLNATGFGFSLAATDTVDGIVVEVERSADASVSIKDLAVRIIKGGTVGATDKASATGWPTSDAYATYGGAADLWGETWTYTDINASNFGTAISAQCYSGTATASIDHIRITVYYTAAGASGQPMALRQSQTRQGFARAGRGF